MPSLIKPSVGRGWGSPRLDSVERDGDHCGDLPAEHDEQPVPEPAGVPCRSDWGEGHRVGLGQPLALHASCTACHASAPPPTCKPVPGKRRRVPRERRKTGESWKFIILWFETTHFGQAVVLNGGPEGKKDSHFLRTALPGMGCYKLVPSGPSLMPSGCTTIWLASWFSRSSNAQRGPQLPSTIECRKNKKKLRNFSAKAGQRSGRNWFPVTMNIRHPPKTSRNTFSFL